MRRHIRPERLTELLDDLTVICEDLVAAREPAPGNGLVGLPRRPMAANPQRRAAAQWLVNDD